MNKDIPRIFHLDEFIDHRGDLVVGEFSRHVPFEVKRFFFIRNVPTGEPRGFHAHMECHQFLVCVSGSVKADVDNGYSSQTVELDSGNKGLYMPPMTWGAQYDYSQDALLLVLASHVYDPEDYIHEYETFKQQAKLFGGEK